MEKGYKKIKSLRIHNGHKLYKVNIETLEIFEVEYTTLPLKGSEGSSKRGKKVIMEKRFFYISALNVKNVKRKLVKMANENK